MEPACDFVDFVEVVTYRGHGTVEAARAWCRFFRGSDGQAFFASKCKDEELDVKAVKLRGRDRCASIFKSKLITWRPD